MFGVGKSWFYCLVVVADIIFFEFVDILLLDGGDNGLNCHGVDDHLKMVLCPVEFVVLLKLYKVPAFCVICDVWVDEGRIFEPGAVEALVRGDKAYFCLVEDEREVAVAAAPCCRVEMAREGGELLDEYAHGREGWLANDWLNRDSDHAAAHHFSDGGHGGCDRRHYSPATVAHVCGRNVVPCCWWP